ncbi:MAG: DinB family protein [Bacteroidota bacterium]|nr:DinB family protein [Bacteroidota bacterium]
MEVAVLFERDLNKLIAEINLFKNEEDAWKIKDGISNSAGNLTLHLVGNLNYFIGTISSNTNYVRDRDKEFSEKNIPRNVLVEELQKLISLIKNTLPKLPEQTLKKDFPIPLNGNILSTEDLLIYLLAHLNYHLGQVNYLRRIIN